MKTTVAGPPAAPCPATSFRLYLRAELARRCAANPHYSLRAFARVLRLHHATLSQLLRAHAATLAWFTLPRV